MFRNSKNSIADHVLTFATGSMWKTLWSIALVAQLVGCRATYDIGVYEQSLLALAGRDGVKQSEALLNQSIISAELVSATIPPGVYADHGILLHLSGKTAQAVAQIGKEGQLYPESKEFTNALLRIIQKTEVEQLDSSLSQHRNPSVLILPPINNSGKPEAGAAFEMTLVPQFIGRGYYTFPILATQAVLARANIKPVNVPGIEPSYLNKLTGADAVLFVTINKWEYTETLGPRIHVGAEYLLIEAITGRELWKSTVSGAFDPTVVGGGYPVYAMARDLRIPARSLTKKAITSSDNKLPYGPYH